MRRVLPIAVAALLAMVPSANAATTIGQVFTPTAQTTATVAQTGITSGTGYTVPSDGVITAWGFQADPDGAALRLTVVRSLGGDQYTVVGESDPVTATPNQTQSFSTRVPVKAGDYVGTVASSGKSVAYTGAQTDTVVLTPGDQPPGSSGTYSNVQGIRMDVTATIEPDADGDGFGDETQDICPTDPTLQTKCLADLSTHVSLSRKSANPGEEVRFDVAIRNGGPSVSTGVKLRAELSPELKLMGASGANCSGGPTITCQVGDVGRDANPVVSFVARADAVGIGTIAVQADGTTEDGNEANNAAGGSLFVIWKRGRCANEIGATDRRNVLRGTIAGDLIDALAGNDIIGGRGGADCIAGGAGDDHISGDGGADRISGDEGNDILDGGSGNDRVDGGAGKDRIAGGTGADRLNGGSGNDSVNAVDG